MLRNKELGRVLVDAGDVVVFSMDQVMRLAEKLKIDESTLIARYEGVSCDFGADGTYGVDRLFAIDLQGKTYPVVMIGGEPDQFLRFLGHGEQTFHDFYEAHPRKAEVGQGETYNRAVFDEIAAEYRKKLLETAPFYDQYWDKRPEELAAKRKALGLDGGFRQMP